MVEEKLVNLLVFLIMNRQQKVMTQRKASKSLLEIHYEIKYK